MQMIDGKANTADVASLESYVAQIRLAMSGIDELLSNINYVVGIPESERLAEAEQRPERSEPTFVADGSRKVSRDGSGKLLLVHTFPG